jgi:hypothetical protein
MFDPVTTVAVATDETPGRSRAICSLGTWWLLLPLLLLAFTGRSQQLQQQQLRPHQCIHLTGKPNRQPQQHADSSITYTCYLSPKPMKFGSRVFTPYTI